MLQRLPDSLLKAGYGTGMSKNKNKQYGDASETIFDQCSAKQLLLRGRYQPLLAHHLPNLNLNRFCTSSSFCTTATHILNHGKSDLRHYLQSYLLLHAPDLIYSNDFSLDI
jgi:hypothetical protein